MEPETETEVENKAARGMAELVAIVEALIFVADEPITTKLLAERSKTADLPERVK